MAELLYKEEVFQLVGAAMEVYNNLGPGFLELVYQEALEIELAERGISFSSQPDLGIYYKGRKLQKSYIADFVVFGTVIVEMKALDRLTTREEAQLLNYLKATRCEVGVLINFGAPSRLEWKRMVRTRAPWRAKSFAPIRVHSRITTPLVDGAHRVQHNRACIESTCPANCAM